MATEKFPVVGIALFGGEKNINTWYHAKYHAYKLTKQTSDNSLDKLSMSLFDAAVDLNPHQVDAALFAFQSPLSKGVLLADEVGLGKTIEAGLVLCQYWAERKRRLLVICPASLRKQWSLELEEKFNLPTFIMDAKSYREALRDGMEQPFSQRCVTIVSMNYANTRKEEVKAIPWNLVVIDEAHKLRNAYRSSNRIGQGIRWALMDRKKLLLTATPLQNSLLELYGLSTIIDEFIFGDLASYRSQYCGQDGDLPELRERLAGFCKRTLRQEVLEYIRYTERRAITTPFQPSDAEQALYEAISEFLRRDDTYSIPAQQKTLTTLILRKLLASSSSAVVATLTTMRRRLENMLADADKEIRLEDELILEAELSDEEAEEMIELDRDADSNIVDKDSGDSPKPPSAFEKIQKEIEELEQYIRWGEGIQTDTKSHALLTALDIGFQNMAAMGANRKALIFTESRRTQDYLKTFLEANGFAGQVVLFNGSNSDKESNRIFEEWIKINEKTGRLSGSWQADKRLALIEHFQDTASIMIATEAAAEGVNLQFCSLVVNYDLPWNPQRIEQRIGRCHRYGQQHDVVVINFLNERNAADRRVFEILRDKFQLFSGVFGASDEVLGSIESGVDFERRILAIYQQCRSQTEIEQAFKILQDEMEITITSRLAETRRSLLENFDQDVHDRLKVSLGEARDQLNQWGRLFWGVTRLVLENEAEFDDQNMSFELAESPVSEISAGYYQMITKDRPMENGPFVYRLSHPLGDYVLDKAKSEPTPPAHLRFDISHHPVKISVLEDLQGQRGYLILNKLTIDSFERDEHLLFSAFTEKGEYLDPEICDKLFQCRASVEDNQISSDAMKKLNAEAQRHTKATIHQALELSTRFFREERDRLGKWAEDLVVAAEKELRDTKTKIKQWQRQARSATTLGEQHEIESKLLELQRLQRRQRQHIFDVEDEIIAKRDGLIRDLEARMQQTVHEQTLFQISWEVS